MQSNKHVIYEPVGCENAAFESSFSGRENPARKNLNELFQQAMNENKSSQQDQQRQQSHSQCQVQQPDVQEFDASATGSDRIRVNTGSGTSSGREEEYVEIILNDDSAVSLTNQARQGQLENEVVNAQSLLYPIEATTIDEDSELKNSPIRTPSFKTAISSSEDCLEVKKPELNIKPVIYPSSSENSKCSSSVTSLPTSPRAPNQATSTPDSYSGTAQPHLSSSILSDNGICRICHEGDITEELVAPCHCAGSVGALHITCLERWLGTSNTTRCELCKYQFKVERQAQSIWKFFNHPTVRSDRRNMMCDVICFLILTPLTGISAFLCMMGVQHYAQWDGRWEVPGLAILTSCLLIIYCIWCGVAVRHHFKVCREWQNQNQVIKIKYLSPTRGKAILETKKVQDKNQSQTSPSRQLLISPCTSTPSPQGPAQSFNHTLLRPILRYSANLDSFNTSHPLDSHFSNFLWTENEMGHNERNTLITTSLSSDIIRAARETYV